MKRSLKKIFLINYHLLEMNVSLLKKMTDYENVMNNLHINKTKLKTITISFISSYELMSFFFFNWFKIKENNYQKNNENRKRKSHRKILAISNFYKIEKRMYVLLFLKTNDEHLYIKYDSIIV